MVALGPPLPTARRSPSPGPSVAVGVLQQQALVAGQRVGVVVLHQAAHAHKQDLPLQVEFRVLKGRGDKVRDAGPAFPSLQNGVDGPVPTVPSSCLTPRSATGAQARL